MEATANEHEHYAYVDLLPVDMERQELADQESDAHGKPGCKPTAIALLALVLALPILSLAAVVRGRRKCPTCHGFGVVMGKDGESKPCWNAQCNGGWINE